LRKTNKTAIYETGEMLYTYSDYPSADGQALGSITHVTDENGNMLHRQSFGAWGRERDPDSYEHIVQPHCHAAPTNDRGYTGYCLSRTCFRENTAPTPP
jgi:hypothetical protein